MDRNTDMTSSQYDPITSSRQLASALDRDIQAQGLTRAQVSRRLNLPASSLNRWLGNVDPLPLEQAAKIAGAIGKRIVYRLEPL